MSNATRPIAHILSYKDRYKTEISKLSKELQYLKAELVHLKELELENNRLRKLLGFKEGFRYKTIAARVLAWDPSGWHRVLLLNKGAVSGIEKDSAVIVQEGLIGRVIEVGQRWSKVILIDDSNSKVSVIIQRTRELCVAVGIGKGLCKLSYLSSQMDVKIGDVIVTAGLGDTFPKGIMVGEVVDIKSASEGNQKGRIQSGLSVLVRPSANLYKIEEVLCLKK